MLIKSRDYITEIMFLSYNPDLHDTSIKRYSRRVYVVEDGKKRVCVYTR